jgi:hypothetical protein
MSQPLEPRAPRRERGVESGQSRAALRLSQQLKQPVHRRRAAERQAVDQIRVIEYVMLRGEGAEAVADKNQRQPGVPLPGEAGERDLVLNEEVPAVLPEHARSGVHAQAVAAVVLRVDDKSTVRQFRGQRAVAERVFARPVRDLHDAARRACGLPLVNVDPYAVLAGEGEHVAAPQGSSSGLVVRSGRQVFLSGAPCRHQGRMIQVTLRCSSPHL